VSQYSVNTFAEYICINKLTMRTTDVSYKGVSKIFRTEPITEKQ